MSIPNSGQIPHSGQKPRDEKPKGGKPRVSSTASAQFIYDDPRAAITRPDQFASLSHYFITNWLPQISPNGLKILMRLRSLGYYQPKTGVQRGDIDIDQALLAEQCGMGLRTLQRIFSEDAILSKYVQRVFRAERDRSGRIVREHYLYVVKMDDVLTPDDEARLAGAAQGEDKPTRQAETPTRQNDASEAEPTRHYGGSACQSDAPTRQNDAPTRHYGGSYKESLTLNTEEDTSVTAAAGAGSLALFPDKRGWAALTATEQQPYRDQAKAETQHYAAEAGADVWARIGPKLNEARAQHIYEKGLDETAQKGGTV